MKTEFWAIGQVPIDNHFKPGSKWRSSTFRYYNNLPFQPEKRLPKSRKKQATKQLDTSSCDVKARKLSSSSSKSSCYTVKTRRPRSPDEKPPARRHSTTTTDSVLLSMRHPNILYALDLRSGSSSDLQPAPTYTGVTLATLIQRAGRGLSSAEADCYFAQLIAGLTYLHALSISHRDLNPSNLLLTTTGTLKIANFTASEYLRPPSSSSSSSSGGRSRKRCCGTAPYLAPEVLLIHDDQRDFDARAVDMWAVGVVYLELRTGTLAWALAAEGADEGYDQYLSERISLWGFRPIENLKNRHCRRVIQTLLDPDPGERMAASQVRRSPWCAGIELCEAALGG
ncbi:uncharacterized protein L3040_003996 [Drepanopeziza brunnea f. sp. 'multigermtubi']|uniref:uncharacterized protein n=1 Tax=Drepanopeziza brunnea f. sp. 'multigermtubi' TaxID=698441 RepID=UPI0023A5BF45|nr:hypothetical protein L3040_003996 [Drepanopeziza brunnea f. sp. 'multigermtubi']